MKHIPKAIRYHFASKKLLMAQAEDLHRQLLIAWEERDAWKKALDSWKESNVELSEMALFYSKRLGEMSSMFYKERERRMKTEDMLLDHFLDNEEE